MFHVRIFHIVIVPGLMVTVCSSRDKAQEIGEARWVERAVVAAEVAGQIKGLWKLLE